MRNIKMRNIMDIYGKRIRANRALKMVRGHPKGYVIDTLPAGKPSPLIDSYLPSGNFQLIGTPEYNYYVQDASDIEIIDAKAKDTSVVGSGLTTAVADWWSNVSGKTERNIGFLGEGFSEATSSLIPSVKEIQRVLLIGVFILFLVLILVLVVRAIIRKMII